MFSTSYNSTQKAALQQFMSFTQTSERSAAKTLKQHNWNLEQALDGYFHQNANAQTGSTDKTALNGIFDQFRQPEDAPDTMSVGGAMAYFESLGLSLEDSVVIAVSEALKSPAMGEFKREGFVDGWGWRGLGCNSIDQMKAKIPALRQSMDQDEQFFKRVYLWTFGWARTEGQKGLPLEVAIEWWKILFKNKFSGHLDTWIQFLTEKWNKSVPKDTWNMLYDFTQFAEKDPTLDSYDEEGAWPSVIDGYVEFYREQKK